MEHHCRFPEYILKLEELDNKDDLSVNSLENTIKIKRLKVYNIKFKCFPVKEVVYIISHFKQRMTNPRMSTFCIAYLWVVKKWEWCDGL